MTMVWEKRVAIVMLAMVAGLPVIGIGAYVSVVGWHLRRAAQSRLAEQATIGRDLGCVLSPQVKSLIMIMAGSLLIVGGLGFPVLVWWIIRPDGQGL